jgi:isopenicillin-N epimerase
MTMPAIGTPLVRAAAISAAIREKIRQPHMILTVGEKTCNPRQCGMQGMRLRAPPVNAAASIRKDGKSPDPFSCFVPRKLASRRGTIGYVDPVILEAFGLDPEILHLNHGAFGVAPVAVRRAAAAWREHAERNPHRFNRVEIPGLVAAARERAAGFLGIDPSRAAWVRNVSEGVSAVLSSLELSRGQELVIGTHGYGAVRKALNHHAARVGARVIEAGFPVGAEDGMIVAAYAAACSRRTRLVVVDRITSPTATILPVAAVAAAARAVGARVLVDAAHAPGQLPDDIAALGADHWIGNLHKWAYAPRGSAILWSRPVPT